MNFIFSAPFLLIFNFTLVTLVSDQLGYFYSFSNLYYLYLIIVLSVFTISYILGRLIYWPKVKLFKFNIYLEKENKIKYYRISLILGMILIMLDHILISGPNFYTSDAITAYRFYLTELGGTSKVPFIPLFNFFFFCAIPFLISNSKHLAKENKYLYWFSVLFYIFLSSARSSLFFFMLLAFFYYFGYKKITFKTLIMIVLIVACSIIGFSLIGSLVGKDVKDSAVFFIYWIGGAHVLDIILNNINFIHYPLVSFRPFQKIIELFGIPTISSQGLLPYYYTPFPTNVFSIFGVYVLDFGIGGSLVCMSFFGFLSGHIEKLLVSISTRSYIRLIYSLNCTILVLGVFHDYYTSSGITYTIILLGLFFFD